MEDIEKLKPKIVEILLKNDVDRAGLFGSYARGEQTEDSDIDILIKFRGRRSLLDLVHTENELKDNLNRDVDLVTYDSLHHLLRDSILKDEVRII
jgi:hypothetical protein